MSFSALHQCCRKNGFAMPQQQIKSLLRVILTYSVTVFVTHDINGNTLTQSSISKYNKQNRKSKRVSTNSMFLGGMIFNCVLKAI